MADTILVVNAGSSSIKFQLFAVGSHDGLERRFRGQIEGIGTRPRLLAKDVKGAILIDETLPVEDVRNVPAALDKVITFLRGELGGRLPTAIGHRVVHGGPEYSDPTVISTAVLDRLQRFTALAPLHQPNNLAPIRAILERQPHLLQVACFDTAFHRGHPELADCYAIPQQLYLEGDTPLRISWSLLRVHRRTARRGRARNRKWQGRCCASRQRRLHVCDLRRQKR